MKSIANSTFKGIIFREEKKWDYNPNTKTLDFVASDLENKSDKQIMGEVLHNIGHALFTSPVNIRTAPEPKKKYLQLMNTIEDIRVEEQMMKYYPWTYDNFLYRFKKQNSEISSSVEEELRTDKQYLYMLWMFYRWQEPENINPEVLDVIEKTKESVYKAYDIENSKEMVEFVGKEIRPFFQKLIPEDIDIEEESVTIDNMKDDMKEKSKSVRSDKKEEFGKNVDEEVRESEQPDEVLTDVVEQQIGVIPYEELYKEVVPIIPYFVKKLGSILKDNKYDRTWWNFRSGKLDTKKLYKWKCGSDKLFTRKIERKHKDYNVSLLVDESGSMCDCNKNRNAFKATILLAEVLNKVWINFSISWFNTTTRVYKKFSEKFCWKNRRWMESIINESGWKNSWGTNDWYNIREASMWFTGEAERILIFISDGDTSPTNTISPTGKKYSEYNLAFEVEKASKYAIVIGVWINSPNISKYFKNNICSWIDELPKLLMNVLKKNIKRG